MSIKKAKLNYMSAVSNTPPVALVAVPSSHMEELDRAIRQKVRQNEAEHIASIETIGKLRVR